MRTYAEAVRYAEKQHLNPSQSWYRLCQMFARNCVGAAPFGLTAYQAWQSIEAKHRHGGAPPPGSIAYWRGPAGSAGHAAFAVENHKIWSNDIERNGKIDKVPYTAIADEWGFTYLGWIDHCPSGALPVLAPVVSKPVVHLSRVQYGLTNTEILRVQKALNAEPGIILDYTSGPGTYGDRTKAAAKAFQLSLGFRKDDADGLLGITSLVELGQRHGFRAAP